MKPEVAEFTSSLRRPCRRSQALTIGLKKMIPVQLKSTKSKERVPATKAAGRVSDRRVIQWSIAKASGWETMPLTLGSPGHRDAMRAITILSARATLRVVSRGYG